MGGQIDDLRVDSGHGVDKHKERDLGTLGSGWAGWPGWCRPVCGRWWAKKNTPKVGLAPVRSVPPPGEGDYMVFFFGFPGRAVRNLGGGGGPV